MLSSLFGKKSDHPLADVRSVQELLNELPKNDAHKSLTELLEWLESLAGSAEFKPEYKFTVLRMLDEAAQPFVRKLVREYFTQYELNKFQENRMWTVLSDWFRQVGGAYFSLFFDYTNNVKGISAIKPHLPLLATRAAHASMWQIKCISSRYEPIDNLIWVNLGHLFRHAESQEYLNLAVTLYPGLKEQSSFRQELASMLTWLDAGLAALSPLYIHLNERILHQYRDTIEIRKEVDKDSRITFDLNRSAEPSRINMGSTTHPAMRFICLPSLQGKLEALLRVLNKEVVPDDINLIGNYDASVVKQAAQFLLNYVIAPPVRRNARRNATVALHITSGGLNRIIAGARGKLPAGQDSTDWITEEISATGFSTHVTAKGNESIGIGSLLGMQPDGMAHWGVAVVRRLQRDDADQLNIGAEILSSQVDCVTLKYEGVTGDDALWLSAKQDDDSGTGLMVMKADTFSPNFSIQFELKGKNYLLIPLNLMEKGLDYDLAKFRFAIQEASEMEQ